MPNLGTKFVRVHTGQRQGFVTFDFAINDPALTVELVLPYESFVEFCELNSVVFMTLEQGARVDEEKLKWRHGLPGRTD